MADQDQRPKKMTLLAGPGVKPREASFAVPEQRPRQAWLCPYCGDPACPNSILGRVVFI